MTFIKTVLLALLLILTAMATAYTSAADNQAATPPGANERPVSEKAPENEYVIQPGDVLGISVWNEPTLQNDVLVRPDGVLNFPLAGDVLAAGKSIDQLRKGLTAMLAKYVPDPVVSVSVKSVAGNKVYVIGKVNKPGEYVTNRSVDVMQMLSMAGGLTPYASPNKIKILRRENGELTSIPFRYSRVEKGEDMEQNIILRGGDVIVVP